MDRPLLRPAVRSPSRNIFLLSVWLAAVVLISINLFSRTKYERSELAQSPLFFAPKQKFLEKTILPVHIEVPVDGGESEYTLVESPYSLVGMLDEIADGVNGTNGTNATNSTPTKEVLKCILKGVTIDGSVDPAIDIKAESLKVFKMWDKCVAAGDYKAPNNKTGSRRLLTQSVVTLKNWKYPGRNVTGDVCGGPSFPCPSLHECETQAAKSLCEYLNKCSNPVCSSYYIDPEIERVCGICTMSASAVTEHCWGSVYSLLRCMGWK